MVFLSFSYMVFLWFSYGFFLAMVFLWFSSRFPEVFLWFSYGFVPMVFIWFSSPFVVFFSTDLHGSRRAQADFKALRAPARCADATAAPVPGSAKPSARPTTK